MSLVRLHRYGYGRSSTMTEKGERVKNDVEEPFHPRIDRTYSHIYLSETLLSTSW